MRNLTRLLVAASEKAANIARVIRQEEELFQLLIEEKECVHKKDNFIRDFKTLADVLIQETVRHDVAAVFPEMADHIYGEESNLFTNANGDTVTITVGETAADTCQMLEHVLPQNPNAARLLAAEVHTVINLTAETELEIQNVPVDLVSSYSNFGIWIDPIDATGEYIKGHTSTPQGAEVNSSGDIEEDILHVNGGLVCATVLIGVFEMDSGQSICGVINQPFWKFHAETQNWTGRHFYGLSFLTYQVSSVVKSSPYSNNLIIISDSEDDTVKAQLASQFQVVSAPGAGYKLLCVIAGLADCYVLSKGSTYLWDTCAPHAILKALGGGMDVLTERLGNPEVKQEIHYQPDIATSGKRFANAAGFIAYRGDSVHVSEALKLLRN